MFQDWHAEILKDKISKQLSIIKSVNTDIQKSSKKEENPEFQKAIDLVNDAILKGECDYLLEKGKKAASGEERTWGANKYRKLPNGKWELVSKDNRSNNKKDEDEASEYRKTKEYADSKDARQKDLDSYNEKKRKQDEEDKELKQGDKVKVKNVGEGVYGHESKEGVYVKFKDGSDGYFNKEDVSGEENPSNGFKIGDKVKVKFKTGDMKSHLGKIEKIEGGKYHIEGLKEPVSKDQVESKQDKEENKKFSKRELNEAQAMLDRWYGKQSTVKKLNELKANK